MNANEEYDKLIKIVNDNLESSDRNKIIFELFSTLSFNIYEFPYEQLLEIQDDSQFLYEVYYKILDRIIDSDSYYRLLKQLLDNKLSKEEIITLISNSKEAEIKKTNLVFKR
ncbi:cytochrome P450 [Gallibacterium salpingitidis]|uniref:hypothetical protein n=1 Tax=Gallibacterium salpingitidis TaxID=505341 RepID=UPI00266EDD93|nr:hypothetical protein [Gallibacterium salpingitidis]WKT00463.1 cytochrome P450 [Gallibacterium salpingitidis]